MIKHEDECVGCPPEMGCLGKTNCPYMDVPHLYCDECEEEYDYLREYDNQQLCDNCLLKKFVIIEGSNND